MLNNNLGIREMLEIKNGRLEFYKNNNAKVGHAIASSINTLINNLYSKGYYINYLGKKISIHSARFCLIDAEILCTIDQIYDEIYINKLYLKDKEMISNTPPYTKIFGDSFKLKESELKTYSRFPIEEINIFDFSSYRYYNAVPTLIK